MDLIKRSTFLKKIGYIATSGIIYPFLSKLYANELTTRGKKGFSPGSEVFISKNGDPKINMRKVIEMAGGINNFIDIDDTVIIKPNLQWKYQGYTHTLATKTLIEIILNRLGGFNGEILVSEDYTSFDDQSKGWNSSPENRLNNWPDMNYRELINFFHLNGAENVSATPISGKTITGPEEGEGYVINFYTTQSNTNKVGLRVRLGYPIIQSPFSGNLIDTKNGVWKNGEYTGQKVKIIFLPTLNYHSNYAGITSAVKCHLGFIPLGEGNDEYYSVHTYKFDYSLFRPDEFNKADIVGECIGELISAIIKPTLYITVAEYSGHMGRTKKDATHTKTIGLCREPVSLDYWMGKNIICPSGGFAADYDPSEDNVFRQTLIGCNSKGIGTLNEADMLVQIYDHDNPQTTRIDIEKKIKLFKEGKATETEVLKLIEHYMNGN